MKTLKRLTLLCLLLPFAGCSTGFVYNQLDWLIPWYLGDYVDLTRPQKQTLKEQLAPLLEWHRVEELRSYVVILEGINDDLAQPVQAQSVRGWSDSIMEAYQRLESRALPLAFSLGETLSEKQIDDFLEELRKEQAELEDEFLGRSLEEFYDYSYENFVENLGNQLGRLSEEQKETLYTASRNMTRFDESWLSERQRWLEQLERELQREPGWQDRIRLLLDRREMERRGNYSEALAHNESVIYQAIADVLNQRSEKQDKRLRREISDLLRTLEKLIAQKRAA